MPDQKVDNTPKIEKKPSTVQDIQTKLEAKNQYDRQYQAWETTKRVAQEAGSEIPVEPVASEEAVQGKILSKTLDKAKEDGNAIFSGGGDEKLNARFEKIIKKINENPDEESKIMQVAGVIEGIGNHLYSQKYEHVSTLLDTAPEAMSFSNLLVDFYPRGFTDYGSKGIESLKSDAAQNVLKHLASELSPAYPDKKEEYKFDAEVGKGMKAFDVLFKATIEKKLNPTPEQIKIAFGFGENISIDDINRACKDLFDNFRATQGADSRVNARTLSPDGFISSVENIPLILSKIAQQKPEVAEDIKGKLMGYNRLLAGKRPNLDNSGGYDYDAKVDSYLSITQKITQSILDFYNPETVNIYNDVLQKQAENPFDREFQELFRDCRLDAHDNKGTPLNRHFKKHLEIKDAARQKEKDDQIRMENEKNEQKKKSVEDLVQKFSNSTDIKNTFWSLYRTDVNNTGSSLNSTLVKLDEIKAQSPDLSNVVDFAKAVANKFSELVKDGSLIQQSDIEVSRHKKGLFSKEYDVQRQRSFTVNQEKLNQLSKQAQDEILKESSSDNYAKAEALKFITQRGETKYGYSVVE